jgi:hypothetical protein
MVNHHLSLLRREYSGFLFVGGVCRLGNFSQSGVGKATQCPALPTPDAILLRAIRAAAETGGISIRFLSCPDNIQVRHFPCPNRHHDRTVLDFSLTKHANALFAAQLRSIFVF